ncbi:hypothetical protein DPMN_151202 [Dreissena polymorpha]|uniref:Uncharacterized protein n=1 Tax=Dreissena polymorpha TaxID=45954 RepID=A0A9D4FEU7_DREPO|nr:hypothetical protein DPMN_151202 [Dreissena polymorpha]
MSRSRLCLSNLPEPAVSNSVLTQPETIEYTVVDAGSKRSKPKLLKTDAVADVFAASRRLVDDHMKVFDATDFDLPKPQTLTRILNRAREKHRQTDPSPLDFEVDTDFIGEGFLRVYVRVHGERDLIFASDNQLSRLQQSNRWENVSAIEESWFFTLGANVTQPEKSPTTMRIELGTSRFQIRQTLYRVAIKARTHQLFACTACPDASCCPHDTAHYATEVPLRRVDEGIKECNRRHDHKENRRSRLRKETGKPYKRRDRNPLYRK